MKVLYVNHTAEVSGGERSLLGLLDGLPADVEARLACPAGPLQERARVQHVQTVSIRATTGSLRVHPLHTPKALAEIATAGLGVARAARGFGADVLHANSVRAGLMLAAAPARGAARIVHVRDCLPPGGASALTLRVLAASADVIVANSAYTADSVTSRAPGARVEVVYNAIDTDRFDPLKIDRQQARAALGEQVAGRFVLGVVAQITPWKGQDTAIEALRLLLAEGCDAHLLLVGSAKFVARATRFDNQSYLEALHRQAEQAGLQGRVSFLGEREDVPELIRAMDLLLLPSWEEPFGRALVEAMALEVPVLATSVGGSREVVTDGSEGRIVDPRDAGAWARVAAELARDPQRRRAMGAAGRARVLRDFTGPRHVEAILGAYAGALARRPRRSGM